MKKITPILSSSPDIDKHFVYTLPPRIGDGGVWLDCFASGLQLLYVNMQFKNPVSLKGNQIDWSFGIGFNLKGHSEARFSTCQNPVSISPNTSGHFIYPETTAMEETVKATLKTKLCVLFDSKTLLDFARDDEEVFLPFLEGLSDIRLGFCLL